MSLFRPQENGRRILDPIFVRDCIPGRDSAGGGSAARGAGVDGAAGGGAGGGGGAGRARSYGGGGGGYGGDRGGYGGGGGDYVRVSGSLPLPLPLLSLPRSLSPSFFLSHLLSFYLIL